MVVRHTILITAMTSRKHSGLWAMSTYMTNEPCRIVLFGGLCATQGAQRHTHFETRKTAALLSCLALFPHRSHAREILAEQLWPEEEAETTRSRLRQALSTLRRLLEPAGVPEHSILVAGRNEVRLNSAAVTTDVAEFEAALRSATQAVEVQ